MNAIKRLCRPLTILLFGSLFLVACGDSDANNDTDNAANSQDPHLITSEEGYFTARFAPDPDPPISGINEMVLHINHGPTEGDDPVVDADLTAEPYMPAHGHGTPEIPEVTDDGGGQYTLTNLHYSMPGTWEVRVDVTADDTTDRLIIALDVD